MPGLARKLVVYASINGLVIQAHGAVDHHKAFQIDYKTLRITDCSANGAGNGKKEVQLEAHGLIGLLSIASSSFLVAITRREQVAQLFGKPVYVITDVAFLPISSRHEATQAITAASTPSSSVNAATDSDLSDSDEDAATGQSTHDETGSSPTDDSQSPFHSGTDTNIAQDVFAKRGQFGRFASQWFSRQGWAVGKATASPQPDKAPTGEPGQSSAQGQGNDTGHAAVDANQPDAVEEVAEEPPAQPSGNGEGTSVTAMIPRILRISRMIIASRSFFFSYDVDLTRNIGSLNGALQAPTRTKLDPLHFWNASLAQTLFEAGQESFLMPITQGFVGQRSFVVRKSSTSSDESASVIAVDNQPQQSDTVSHVISQAKEGIAKIDVNSQTYLLTLISRRSTRRSGLRYLRRGIDDEGNCANAVETEQILSSTDWSPSHPIRSFTQYRASIPLYFSQSPYSFKPVPTMHHSQQTNDTAMERHFTDLRNRYGDIQASLLVDKHGTEVSIGEAYEQAVKRLSESGQLKGVALDWFDFHTECRGMKFQNVERLVQKLKETVDSFGETVVLDGVVDKRQTGLIRTNCMDCLDRTNVAESAFGQYMLQTALEKEGFSIDLVRDEQTTWFNTLWADNGDAISRLYAGTAALKGDFTRTRKRDYRGALNDFSLTLTRYYNNMVNDYFSQAVIDLLLGNLSWKGLEDFETRMMSADPGVSVEKVRENAIETCRKLVIQDETEDLIHGWTMLAPAHENTLRSLPFQEAVVMLTDAALYCCKFDWTTEKVASFEKVDLRSISKIRYGTYITSTLSERQMDERLNTGLVVVHNAGKGSLVRTNTRSLQNFVTPPDHSQENRIDGGTGVLSWLAPRSPSTSQVLAVKVIPITSGRGSIVHTQSSTPLGMAQNISVEIFRAMNAGVDKASEPANDIVEKGDIISLAEAKRRTGYLEHLGHSIKKLVWS